MVRGACSTFANTSRSFAPNFLVGCDGGALVIVLNEAGVFPAKLGGITGPGSRPKRTGTGLFFLLQEEHIMTVWEELKARGLIAQVTDEDEIKEMVNNGKATFYIGFDPTADSLHVGHFMALCLMKRLQMAGNRPDRTSRRRNRYDR